MTEVLEINLGRTKGALSLGIPSRPVYKAPIVLTQKNCEDKDKENKEFIDIMKSKQSTIVRCSEIYP